jgi:GT2 family glycosyltransferase
MVTGQLPVTGAALADEFADGVTDGMADASAHSTQAPLALSATICTRNRPALLRRALQSLLAQATPPGEILVVDNAPSDTATRDLVRAEFPTVRYVEEPAPGLDFARNRALKEAAHEIVAFVDDDAVADPDWARTVAAVFTDRPHAGACFGRIDPLSVTGEAERVFEENGGLTSARTSERLWLPAQGAELMGGRWAPTIAWAITAGSGCNMAVRREAALGLGGFDEALDMGAVLPGGGDTDMLWRMVEAGLEVACEPRARVRHEHRREVEAAYRQIVGYHRALSALLAKGIATTRGRRRLELLAFLGWRLVKPGLRLVRRARGHDPLPSRVLLRMWWSVVRGLGAYHEARRLARRRRLEAGYVGPAAGDTSSKNG